MERILNNLQSSVYKQLSGHIGWKSPSNIALIKYWGKFEDQLPANPSLSFSLSECHTETTVQFAPTNEHGISLKFKFEGKEQPTFAERIEMYLKRLSDDLPFVKEYHFGIESKNSFPHSSGIASSASAMSALALCLASIYNRISDQMLEEPDFRKLASYLARLGSGSACRSVYGGFSIWGKSGHFKNSTDLYAIALKKNIAPVFQTLHDDILIVEHGVKAVSSSVGHQLMKDHPFAKKRFKQARENMGRMKDCLVEGDVERFGQIIESEALALHAMMMTSDPSFILFKQGTLEIINRIRQFRLDEKLPVFFTLDAGANVHLIYPDQIAGKVSTFIRSDLLVYCENGQYICDRVGKGPQEIIL